jgi:hypothetical protein
VIVPKDLHVTPDLFIPSIYTETPLEADGELKIKAQHGIGDW